MTERSDPLEPMLSELGRHVRWPAEQDLLPAVRARLDAGPALRPRWRTAALAAAAALVLVAGSLVLSPAAREAVAGLLEVGGVRIGFGGPPTDPGGRLDLGRPVTLEEAEAAVAFPVLVPESLGPPDSVFLGDPSAVSLVWQARGGLPPAPGSDVGLLVAQFPGSLDGGFFEKELGPGSRIEVVTVKGVRGFWIEGAAHLYRYRDPEGRVREESVRLAANVLLWEEDGVTYRIESALPREQALAVAESLRP